MADYNSVPLGEAGTGAAYLLGGSKALQRWMQRDDENAQIRKYNKNQELQRRDQANKNFNANQIKGIPNQHWSAEMNKALNNWREIGAKYMSQGFDPFNPNPNDQGQVEASQQFLQDKSMIEQMLEAQKGYATNLTKRNSDLTKNRYAYEPDTFNPYDFEKNNSLKDLAEGKVSVPELVGAFDYDKHVRSNIPITAKEDSKVVSENGQHFEIKSTEVDMPRLVKTVKNLYSTGAPRQYLENKIGGSIDGILGTTDENKIRSLLDAEFKSPTDNNPIIELKMQGKIPSYNSPEYKAFLDDAVKEQKRAEDIYNQEISRGVEEGISKVNPKYSKQPNFDYEKMDLASQRLELAQAKKDAKSVATPQTSREYRLDGIMGGDILEIDKLQGEVAANPKYGGKALKVDTYKDGSGKMIFHVPDKIKTSQYDVAVQGYDVIIDPKFPAHRNKLNQLISDITGENVPQGSIEGVKGNRNNSKNQSGSKYSSAQEALIKKNMSANPSYSRAEIIKALGL